jgi:hypothetical protein
MVSSRLIGLFAAGVLPLGSPALRVVPRGVAGFAAPAAPSFWDWFAGIIVW